MIRKSEKTLQARRIRNEDAASRETRSYFVASTSTIDTTLSCSERKGNAESFSDHGNSLLIMDPDRFDDLRCKLIIESEVRAY